MGCDIHVHIEVKLNGKWHHLSNPNVDRNYQLFALMAGVRNYDDIEPISQPKGIPEDATTITKIDKRRWSVDAHSASFLNTEELEELKDRTPDAKPFFFYDIFKTWVFGDSLLGFTEYPEDSPPELEDLRVVFWFDN